MKQVQIAAFALMLAAGCAAAVEVNERELKAADGQKIDFVSYTGPHTRIDSLAAIREIGASLGRAVSAEPSKALAAGDRNRYHLLHTVGESAGGKLDADILSIGRSAAVDHINNVRRILAAYLSAAYGYSDADAATLAVFITVYNAVYRGDIAAFQNKYTAAALAELSAENCGLSVNYQDWAGRTQIVIPLLDVNDGGLSTVDTTTLTGKDVIEKMREDEGRGLADRKNMTDLKEREAGSANAKAQTAQKQAVLAEKQVNAQKQKTENAKRDAEAARQDAQAARKAADEHPENKDLQRAADAAERNAAEKQREQEAQEQELRRQEALADAAGKKANEKQALADRKTAEAQDDRKGIAADRHPMSAGETEDAIYGLELVDERTQLSALVKVGAKTGNKMKAPVIYIHGRTLLKAGVNLIAIAGENAGNRAVKLALISPETMEIIKESNETVAEQSILLADGGDFYCIVQNGNNYTLARYDAALNLKQQSSISIKNGTPVTIIDAHIVLTGSDGKVKALNKSDLSLVSR